MSELPLFAKRAGNASRVSKPKPEPELDAAQVLRAVATLIRKPPDWTQGTSFRDRHGRPCLPDLAESRTAYGALAWVASRHEVKNTTMIHVWAVLDRCASNDPGFLHSGAFVHWHDKSGRTHAEVLAFLGRAVTELRT